MGSRLEAPSSSSLWLSLWASDTVDPVCDNLERAWMSIRELNFGLTIDPAFAGDFLEVRGPVAQDLFVHGELLAVRTDEHIYNFLVAW